MGLVHITLMVGLLLLVLVAVPLAKLYMTAGAW